MPTPLQIPLINGVRHSFASVEIKLAGQIYIGCKSINYKRTRSRTFVRGNHPDPIAKTRGSNEYSADIEIYLAEFNLLQAALQALAQQQFGTATGYGDVAFQVLVTYSENGFDTIQDDIQGCTLDSTDASNSEGTEATIRKSDLNPMKILFNGIDDTVTPLQSPGT